MSSSNQKLQRVPLSSLPSPLIRLDRLGKHLSTNAIYIKRDDLLGRMLGGNKLRKLEYIIPLALDAGSDTLITTGSFESNHVCLTVMVARMLDMHAAVVLMGPGGTRQITLNEKIQHRIGVEIRTVDYEEGNLASRASLSERVATRVEELTNELKVRGRRPYFVPAAGCCLEGTYAFLEAFNELHEQMLKIGHDSYDILLAVGTGSTYAGLWCGAKQTKADVKIHGISISRSNPRCTEETTKAAERVCKYLDIPVPAQDEINIIDEYIGEGYAKPTVWSQHAIDLALHMEGLLLDHTYTGKALGGMIKMLEQNRYTERPIVFWHTGGVAGAIDFLIASNLRI